MAKELPDGLIFVKEVDGVVFYVDPVDMKIKTGHFESTSTVSGYFHLAGENNRVTTSLDPNAVCQALISHAGKPIDITRAYGDRIPQGKYILSVTLSMVEEKFLPEVTEESEPKKK